MDKALEKCKHCNYTILYQTQTLILSHLSPPAEDGGLPDVGRGGEIRLIAHQVNADGKTCSSPVLIICLSDRPSPLGGGPYSCAVDFSATGNNFEQVDMQINLPGQNGRSDARSIDLPIVARMPAGSTCKGGADGQTCLVRCLNVSPSTARVVFCKPGPSILSCCCRERKQVRLADVWPSLKSRAYSTIPHRRARDPPRQLPSTR